MKTPNKMKSAGAVALLAMLCATGVRGSFIYNDTFQSYPVASPAPNPLVGGPAGGTWYFVDPTPPTIAANDHRIFDSGTGGSALRSRVWISTANSGTITNAISIPFVKPATNVQIFTLTFLAATDTTTAGRIATFRYEVGSSGGALGFLSGGNLDSSQTFAGLAGYGIAANGAKGKTDDRKFRVVFAATNIITDDKIFVSLTRVTNAGAAGVFMAFDDVTLSVQMGAPVLVENPQPVSATTGDSVSFSAAFANYPSTYQWTRNGQAIPGATDTIYTIPFVTKGDEGSYVLVASSEDASTPTAPAMLTVTDTTAPTLVEARGLLTLQGLRVRFSEPVDESSALAASYSMSGGVAITQVAIFDRFTVQLTTTLLEPATSYTLSVSGVQDLAEIPIAPGSSILWTTPVLIPAARYDAGTTISRPAGPPSPASEQGGFWTHTSNTNAGFLAEAVMDDEGTGYHAWKLSDQNVLANSGPIDYWLPIDQASDNLARSNGWRLIVRSRMISDFYGGAASPLVLYSDPGNPRRFGILFDLNNDGALTAQLLGGSTYTLSGDALSYHTHMLVYDPVTTNASYFFDGQLITPNYIGDANTAYNGVLFGTGSSPGSGEMNFNLVQLDVVGGVRPTLLSSPVNSVNGVGQRATFTASFTPFVAGYQWLSNGIPIHGAVSNSYTTDFLTIGMNGTQYRARALHALGYEESTSATLTVTSDTEPPAVAEVSGSVLLDRLFIRFSEPVIPLHATNIANYTWADAGMKTLAATLLDPVTVELRSSPQEPGTEYTVRISNIRDISNLVIPNNTPATFTSPRLQVMALYDAGTTVTRPSGPPDPASVNGGSWSPDNGNDPMLITGPVVDDLGTGFHAWQVTDQTTANGQFIQYQKAFSLGQIASFQANGWVLSVRGRFVDDFGTGVNIVSQYSDGGNRRWLLWYDLVSGELLVRPQGGTDQIHTVGGGTAEYHLHQLVFDPATSTASYYFDGELKYSGWAGDVPASTIPGVWWGTGSSGSMGSMNFNLVQFQVVEAPVQPAVTVALNGTNIEVNYTGVLEAAAAIDSQWIPVATNAGPAGAIYSVPASSNPTQFFRARTMQ